MSMPLEENVISPTDLEELAAFVDGRLSGERKARVEARLLHDDAYHDLFVDTVRLQAELARQPERGRILRWPTWRLAAPLAAAAMLALVIGVLLRSPQTDWAQHLDPAAVVTPGAPWDDPGWARSRSEDAGVARHTPTQLAFRLGARTVDLRLAVAAADRDSATQLSASCARLARASDLLTATASYERLAQTSGAEPVESLAALVEKAEKSLLEGFADDSPEARFFTLGQWAESGRLAATSRNTAALRRIVHDAPKPVATELTPHVERLTVLVAQKELGEQEWADAVDVWREILRLLAG